MEGPAIGRALLVSVVLLTSGACAVGRNDDGDAKKKTSPEPLPELSEEAAPLDPSLVPSTTAGGGGQGSSPTTPGGGSTGAGATTTAPGSPGGTAPSGTAGGSTGGTAPAARAVPFRHLGQVADGQGDAGLGAPRYIDLVSISFGTNDTDMQVIVDVAEALPALTAQGEVIGLGVDVFRTNPRGESDYQLFADGGSDGWRAYLQTPDGFVEYPGRFSMGGTRLVFEVPWSAVGGRSGFATAVFVDWSKAGGVIAQDGQDAAPNLGTQRIDGAGGAS